jgi:16S rRNA (adenine(1408)-N(1))-methyltransferase
VDVGTGDGRFVHRMALAHPDRLVIGLDPAWQRMIPSARRAPRNALYVCASIEDPPEPLLGRADEVFLNLPWGRLLAGLVLGEADVCGGLRAIAKNGAPLRVVVGTDIWRPPVPKEIRGLPELTGRYVDDTLAPRLAEHGWKVTGFGELDRGEVPSTWAKKLRTGRFVALHAEAVTDLRNVVSA